MVERGDAEPDWRGDVEIKTVPVAREESGLWRIVEDPAEKRRALGALMAQYSRDAHDFPDEAVLRTTIVAVTIERLSGKRSGGDPAKGSGR